MVLKTCGELPSRNTLKQQGSNLSLPLQSFDSHVLLQSYKTTPALLVKFLYKHICCIQVSNPGTNVKQQGYIDWKTDTLKVSIKKSPTACN